MLTRDIETVLVAKIFQDVFEQLTPEQSRRVGSAH